MFFFYHETFSSKTKPLSLNMTDRKVLEVADALLLKSTS